jgi:hypothetical protein
MTIHYANPDETCFTGATFEFRFGAYLDTVVRVFHKPGRIDSALELAAEWLADNADPDVYFSEPDYADAAAELGLNVDDEDAQERIAEHAETDHTYTEAGWLLSQEWSVSEYEGEPFEPPAFDRFDICQAYAAYYAANHQGQWSEGYKTLCRAVKLTSNGGESYSAVPDFDDLSENGQAIYRQLAVRDGR